MRKKLNGVVTLIIYYLLLVTWLMVGNGGWKELQIDFNGEISYLFFR